MGRPFEYSDEEIAFIKANHKIMRKDLHAQFVEKFNRPEITLNAINSICKRNRWLSGRKAKGGSHYPDEVVQFISDNRTMHRVELLNEVNARFDIGMTLNRLNNFCSKHKFLSGRKGYFGEHDGWRKGNPFADLPIGYEAPPDKRGRVYVKVKQPSEYRLKHHLIFEKFHGALPDKHVICFKDGNDQNFDPENLIAVHRGALGTYNRRYKPKENDQSIRPVLLTMAQIDHKIYLKEKKDA